MLEQFFAFLGTLKLQVIAGEFFSNFGEEVLLDMLDDYLAGGDDLEEHAEKISRTLIDIVKREKVTGWYSAPRR